jgi:toxin ParE1/3/4
MARVVRTRRARNDLAEIWLYVANDKPAATDRLLDSINEACQLLAKQPGMGEARPELAAGLRCLPVGNYLTFYQPLPDGIEVVRVLSGARDIDALAW